MVLMTFLTYLATDLDATIGSYARRCDVLDDVCHVRDAIVAAMSEMQDAECAMRDERPSHGGLHTNSQLSAEAFDIRSTAQLGGWLPFGTPYTRVLLRALSRGILLYTDTRDGRLTW